MLVHVHAYGDPAKVPGLVAEHSQRIREQINAREHDEVERLEAEYRRPSIRLAMLDLRSARRLRRIGAKTAKKAEAALAKLRKAARAGCLKIAEEQDRRLPRPAAGRRRPA